MAYPAAGVGRKGGFGYLYATHFKEPFKNALRHVMSSNKLPDGDVADAYFTQTILAEFKKSWAEHVQPVHAEDFAIKSVQRFPSGILPPKLCAGLHTEVMRGLLFLPTLLKLFSLSKMCAGKLLGYAAYY